MHILVIEDHPVYRQAIGLSQPPLAPNSRITALASFAASQETSLDFSTIDVAILDPGAPPVPSKDRTGIEAQRLEQVSNTIKQLREDCVVIVLTGAGSEIEEASMRDAGVDHYLEKQATDMSVLRDIVRAGRPPGTRPTSVVERYYSELNFSETLGYLVAQGIVSTEHASSTLGVSRDTILRYKHRGVSKARRLTPVQRSHSNANSTPDKKEVETSPQKWTTGE